MKPLLFAMLVLSTAAGAQPRERVDSTLPQLESVHRGDRVVGTRALGETARIRLRDDLARQAEIDRLFNPHRVDAGVPPVFASVYPPAYAPCTAPGCPAPRPWSGDPSPRVVNKPVPFPPR